MATARKKSHKHYRLDTTKIKRAQRVLQANTETETIDRALDLVISEDERNRLVRQAHDEFVRSGARVDDVYGALED
jgi:hypothetical protein